MDRTTLIMMCRKRREWKIGMKVISVDILEVSATGRRDFCGTELSVAVLITDV